MLPFLESSQPRRFLEQLAALLRLRAEDLLDPALADDRVHPAAETEVGEQLDEVETANGGSVEQVLALPAPMEAPRDREVGVRERSIVVGVVEEQLDLAEVLGRPAGPARKEHVIGFLGAQLGRSERAGRPDDRVGDVRLPRPVRTNDDGDARLEANLDRFGERLEAAQLYRAQVHVWET